MKKLSIITVCYNNKNGLIKTINSVRNQTFNDYEFIIIDGGSTDGSKEVIEQNKELFSFWCSEPDGGIYQGMNKGIDHATGEYCLFLNSGDYLAHSQVLEKIFEKPLVENIVYGNVIRVKGKKKQVLKYSRQLTFADFYRGSSVIHHQASFIRRELFLKYGKYAENTYMNADWRFFYTSIVLNNVSPKYINKVVSICDASGRSHSYNQTDPRVIQDINAKRNMIKQVIPAIVEKDYDKIMKVSFFSKLWKSFKWRLSPIIPLNLFVRFTK